MNPRLILPVGRLANEVFLGKFKLAEVVGTCKQDDKGRYIVPLPHPSGASLWLNRPEHQARVVQALELLKRLRDELDL